MSEIRQGHVIDLLRAMRAESVHCAISSPPYWGLRAYGTEPQVWPSARKDEEERMKAECEHEWKTQSHDLQPHGDDGSGGNLEGGRASQQATRIGAVESAFCRKCGAWRGELGLEPTPQLYVEHIVEVFREVRRVLRSDGTLWLNMGDGYAAGGRGENEHHTAKMGVKTARAQALGPKNAPAGLKPKDLMGMPWRVAFALQADGWYWRSCIPWLKRNSMPESVTDRPGNAVEYWLLLTKSARYFYDAEAVRMPPTQSTIARVALAESRKAETDTQSTGGRAYKHCESARVSNEKYGGGRDHLVCAPPPGGRSRRNSDWFFESWQGLLTGEDGEPLALVVNPKGFAEAHFACVDTETECLTDSGWKHYTDIGSEDMIAAYDITEHRCEWSPLLGLASYGVQDVEMVRLCGRGIDQLLTPNHRCITRTRAGKISVRRADSLLPSLEVPVAATWKCKDAITDFPARFAALIGWYVTEGCAGADCVTLYQSGDANPSYVSRIDELLRAEGACFVRAERHRPYRDRMTTAVSWRVTGAVANMLLSLCPKKHLPDGFLGWPMNALISLWDALMQGDGHYREGGRQTFVQKDSGLLDQVQALATRLGYATTAHKRSEGTWALYKTQARWRRLRSETSKLIQTVRYTGTVWCPQTKHGTFIARRNGRVFITGNTFPEALVEPCIRAGTSGKGCCPKCGAPWARVIEATDSPHDGNTKSAYAKGMAANRLALARQAARKRGGEYRCESRTTGWQPTCECEQAEPVPCTVLDPFVGSGTVLVVAQRLGRTGIGLELKPEYVAMARKRLAKPVTEEMWR